MTLPIKALTFDTGGTILDWHSGIWPRSPPPAHVAAWSPTGRR